MVSVILFVVFFLAVILISNKTKMNMGVLCLLAAFILGGWYAKASLNNIINYFPLSVLCTLLSTTIFFAYINQTEAFKGVVDRVLYATKGKTWFYPFAIFFSVFLIACIGGNSSAPIIVSPIAFAIAASTGMHPLLAVMSGYLASAGIGMAPWTPGGVVFSGLMEPGAGDKKMTALIMAIIILFVGALLYLIATYFVLGGNKLQDKGTFVAKEPVPFTREQKTALITLLVVMLVALIPAIIKSFSTGTLNKVCTWMGNYMDIKVLCFIGALFLALMKIGDGQKVMREMVPWGIFLDIGGACVLINCAKDMGIIDLISKWASDSLPGWLMPFVCVLVAGLLSFVSNAMVILPMFSPIAATMAVAGGQSPVVLCTCLLVGCVATGLSPVSMGGSLHSLGATKEQREAIFGKQFLAAFIHLGIYLVFALVGGFGLVGKIFGV